MLSETDKAPWEEKAKIERHRYKAQMKEYSKKKNEMPELTNPTKLDVAPTGLKQLIEDVSAIEHSNKRKKAKRRHVASHNPSPSNVVHNDTSQSVSLSQCIPKLYGPLPKSYQKGEQLDSRENSDTVINEVSGTNYGTTPQRVHWIDMAKADENELMSEHQLIEVRNDSCGTTPQRDHWMSGPQEAPIKLLGEDQWKVLLNYLSISDWTIVATVSKTCQANTKREMKLWLEKFFRLNCTTAEHMQQELLLARVDKPGPDDEILAQYGRDTVQRRSLKTLDFGTWLNDEVINFYLKNVLRQREAKKQVSDPTNTKNQGFFNTFFIQQLFQEFSEDRTLKGKYCYSKRIKRWGKRNTPGFDIFKLRRLFIPRNFRNVHWVLIVVDFEHKTITYYDSLGETDWSCMEGIYRYLKEEHMQLYGESMNGKGWSFVSYPRNIPQQENGKWTGCLSYVTHLKQKTNKIKHGTKCWQRM